MPGKDENDTFVVPQPIFINPSVVAVNDMDVPKGRLPLAGVSVALQEHLGSGGDEDGVGLGVGLGVGVGVGDGLGVGVGVGFAFVWKQYNLLMVEHVNTVE